MLLFNISEKRTLKFAILPLFFTEKHNIVFVFFSFNKSKAIHIWTKSQSLP